MFSIVASQLSGACAVFFHLKKKKKKNKPTHRKKKKKGKLKVTAKTDQFHQKCSRELFSQPWKLCGSLHPSKLHCPDRFYLPTKNTEWRYQLITRLVLLLAESVFVFQEQNQVLDHKIFRNKARVSLSFAKMQWLSFISCHRGDPEAAAIIYHNFVEITTEIGVHGYCIWILLNMCISLPRNLLKYSRARDREKSDSESSLQVKSNHSHSLDVKTAANSLSVAPDLGLDWPAEEPANTRTLVGPVTYVPLKWTHPTSNW